MMRRCCAFLVAVGLGLSVPASPLEPTSRDLWVAENFIMPGVQQELGRDVYGRTWDFSASDRGNFAGCDEKVGSLSVTQDGSLTFTLEQRQGALFWGNSEGGQPLDERIHLWAGNNNIRLKVRQSAEAKSVWRISFSHDAKESRGKRGRATFVEAELEGTEWTTLEFQSAVNPYHTLAGIVPDGFVLEIEGAPGNTVEIGSLEITRELREGYYRKEIELPAGTVWRAMAEVGFGTYLYINGQEVDVEHACLKRPSLDGPALFRAHRGVHAATRSIDLKSYLRPGRNCLGIYGKQVEDSLMIFLQGQVVMASGETVRIDTDGTWQFSPTASEGWNRVGFDDSAWTAPETASWERRIKVGRHGYTDFLIYPWLVDIGGWIGPAFPVYDGRIAIESPDDSKLFFADREPVSVRVRIPAGLEPRAPRIEWVLTHAGEEGESETGKGEVSEFRKEDDSLVFELEAGQLDRGIYALQVSLLSGEGEVLEVRPREPIAVLGRIPMQDVAGDSYADGLDLTLEDTIDFTDPGDPHPWVETAGKPAKRNAPRPAKTEPTVVRKDGLVYRETDALERGSAIPVFSYQFEFDDPNAFYLMVLEYPNDADRWIGVSCCTVHDRVSRAGPSVWTGDRYPLSGTLQELKWVFRSGPGIHTIDILPLQWGATAAAARLRIYRINELPALKLDPVGTGDRWFGIYTERTAVKRGFWRTFGRTRAEEQRIELPDDWAEFRPIPERLQYLRDAMDACEWFARYCRFTGQNLHAMGCHQYSPGNTGFTPGEALPSSQVPRDLREMAVRVFGHNGIDVLGVVSYAGHKCLGVENPWNDGQVAMGKDTAVIVSKDGTQPPARDGGRAYGSGWNPLHPRVESLMLEVAEAVAHKFKEHDNFLGVNWTAYMTGEWLPGFGGMRWSEALLHSYDDATIRRFEQDTGTKVPGAADDPERFGKRHAFLTGQDMQDTWVEWRCRKLHEFFRKVRDRVTGAREDLALFKALYIDVPHDVAWVQSDKPLTRFLREWGWDLSLYKDESHLWPTRWVHAILHGWPSRNRDGWPAGWEQTVGPEFIDLYDDVANRATMVMHQWYEITYAFPNTVMTGRHAYEFTDEPEWPVTGYIGRCLVQPNGDYARETFTHSLIGTDPQVMMYAFMDVNMIVGQEQELREFARVIQALPGGVFTPALDTGLRTNFAIRQRRQDGALFVYVANPGCWSIRGSVVVEGAGRVLDLVSGRPVAGSAAEGALQIPVALDPYAVTAFRIDGDTARLTGWRNEPIAEKDLAHLRGILGRTAALLKDKDASAALEPEDASFMEQAQVTAATALDAGRLAEAWSILTHWRYWTLLKQTLEPSAGL